MPSVSVIIPAYNRASLVREAIESVTAQTYRDFEVIVVDDGSTDATRLVVESFRGSVRYLCQANLGRASARNHGLREAQGRYILFLDSDDLLLSDSLSLLAGFLDAHPDVGAVYSDGVYCDADGRDLGPVYIELPRIIAQGQAGFVEQMVLTNVVGPIHSVMVRRKWLDRIDPPGFDESLQVTEDSDLWFRLALAGCTFRHLRHPTCKYRIHSGNSCANGYLGNQRHRESYLRRRLGIFQSDTFLQVSPSTQATFLYCLLLDPIHGDLAPRATVLASDRFSQLPPRVQSWLLYLLAVDDLLHGREPALVRERLARAVALNPRSLKYRIASGMVSLNPQALAWSVSFARWLRGLIRAAREHRDFHGSRTARPVGAE